MQNYPSFASLVQDV